MRVAPLATVPLPVWRVDTISTVRCDWSNISLIAANAEYGGSDGIYLVGVGVGGGSYNDELMDEVTDAGKGAAVFARSAF